MTEGEWERVRSDGVVSLSYFMNADAPTMAAGDADPEHRLRFDFPDDFIPTSEHAENVIVRWETHPGHRGRGVARRAVALICAHALEEMEFRRLEIVTDEDNAGARKVALQNGFEELGRRGERVRYAFPADPTRSHSG